ncbi:hypothetical protein B0H14DRAFT_2618212 [Mycena olivaceomarginata]|nr:hypothetical protein B0H14DRAFT_2618212 [Mycena olivaceomarginata]
MAAVIVSHDRPADPILPTPLFLRDSRQRTTSHADPTKAIVHGRGPDESDGFTFYLLPAYPEQGWYIGTFVGLSDRLTRTEFISVLFNKLIGDRDVIKFIQEHHDRIPDAPDITFAVRVMLEYADVKACRIYRPVYMPVQT